jgi:DNA modification methylase
MVKLNHVECMDCLECLKTVPDDFVDLIVTDPPYNVSQKTNMSYKGRTIVKNFGDWDFGFDPLPVLKEMKRVLKPNGQIFVFCGTEQIPIYMQEFQNNWYFRNLLVWYKTNPAPRLSKTNFVFANKYIVYTINEKGRPSDSVFNFKK